MKPRLSDTTAHSLATTAIGCAGYLLGIAAAHRNTILLCVAGIVYTAAISSAAKVFVKRERRIANPFEELNYSAFRDWLRREQRMERMRQ